MKYTIGKSNQPNITSYPCLMQSARGRDAVVLFTARKTGMELLNIGFGASEDCWLAADNEAEWKPFVGTITVSA